LKTRLLIREINLAFLRSRPIWLQSLPTLLLISCFFVLSSLCVWSVQVHAEGNMGIFIRHLISISLGFGVFTAVAFFGFHNLRALALPLYLLSTFFLILVLAIGPVIAGSQRWLYFGSISFQPSELTKLVLIISLAHHLSRIERFDWKQSCLFALHIGIPFLLIYKEPDLGTSLILIGISLSMLIVSPLSSLVLTVLITPLISLGLFFWNSWLWLVYVGVGGSVWLVWFLVARWNRRPALVGLVVGSLLLGLNISIPGLTEWGWEHLQPYQKQRILTFIAPEPDLMNAGYQVTQSKIAVGAGGFWGKGFTHGSQTQLRYVPEQHTDFIFSALAEEGGFWLSALVILLFMLLLFRILWVGFHCAEPGELYVCCGVAALELMHLLINMGMNMDMMPVTGVPLPFFSYGGTAILMHMSLLGLVESIAWAQRGSRLIRIA
jgi:rod shape determining protein RodA